MNKRELAKAAQVLTTAYDREFDKPKLQLWYSMFEHVPAKKLAEAIRRHITDPDQGRFFPTPAHIMKHLVTTETGIKLKAAEQFDMNPGIDGTDSFTQRLETEFSRSLRRREFIAEQLQAWQELSFPAKLFHSEVITHDEKLTIEEQNARLTNG